MWQLTFLANFPLKPAVGSPATRAELGRERAPSLRLASGQILWPIREQLGRFVARRCCCIIAVRKGDRRRQVLARPSRPPGQKARRAPKVPRQRQRQKRIKEKKRPQSNWQRVRAALSLSFGCARRCSDGGRAGQRQCCYTCRTANIASAHRGRVVTGKEDATNTHYCNAAAAAAVFTICFPFFFCCCCVVSVWCECCSCCF